VTERVFSLGLVSYVHAQPCRSSCTAGPLNRQGTSVVTCAQRCKILRSGRSGAQSAAHGVQRDQLVLHIVGCLAGHFIRSLECDFADCLVRVRPRQSPGEGYQYAVINQSL
jgi:hypothetical protein